MQPRTSTDTSRLTVRLLPVSRRSVPMRTSLYVAPHLDSAELDLTKEERTQKYLMGMTSAFFVLLAPISILR